MTASGSPGPEKDEPEGEASATGAKEPAPALGDKPVLDWTSEDWAKWIDSGGGPKATAPDAAVVDAAVVDAEAPVEGQEPAHAATSAEPGFAPAAEEIEAPAQTAVPADLDPPPSVSDASSPVFHHAAGPPTAVEPSSEPLPLAEAIDEPAATEADPSPPSPATITFPDPDEEVLPAASDQPDEIVVDDQAPPGADAVDDWAAVSNHPWWESAPVLAPEPVVFGDDPPTSVEAPVPRPTPEPARPAPERAPVRTTRPMPARAPVRSDVIRAQPPERNHRVRSAFGLLGVAMSVGVVVAGLITVAIFAISLALRRAVG